VEYTHKTQIMLATAVMYVQGDSGSTVKSVE